MESKLLFNDQPRTHTRAQKGKEKTRHGLFFCGAARGVSGWGFKGKGGERGGERGGENKFRGVGAGGGGMEGAQRLRTRV